MEKPIIAMRTNRSKEETVLRKVLSQRVAEGTMEGLVDYVTDARGDEFNPAYESEDEKRLAGRIRAWKKDVTSRPESGTINLRYVDTGDKLSPPIPLESRVEDYLGRMLKPKVAQTESGQREYQEAELVMEYNEAGGR